jgi:hypothetical protein
LLDTGQAKGSRRYFLLLQYQFLGFWQPEIVDLQLLQLGSNFVIIALPGEFTTMSARRVRALVSSPVSFSQLGDFTPGCPNIDQQRLPGGHHRGHLWA